MRIFEIIAKSEEAKKRIVKQLRREYSLIQREIRQRNIKGKVKEAIRWLFGN